MDSQFLATQRAFDSVAADYDGPLGNNLLIQRMRGSVEQAIELAFPRGSRLLDLGCGTGIDAEYLAARGYSITALDASPAMVARTKDRLRRAGQDAQVLNLGIQELAQLDAGLFDGAYSDLGALNCLPELHSVSPALAARLRPGGRLVAAVIGRYCPWEVGWYGLRGNWRRATVRWKRGVVPVPLNGQAVWTRYYTPREFGGELASEFVPLHWRALALFAPPPYLAHWAVRFPRLVGVLERADHTLGNIPVLREAGDHFLMVLVKK
jgi:SAM-dependent methyltransferase